MNTLPIILVEDDASLRAGMCEYLSLKGFQVSAVGSGVEFFQAVSAKSFAVAIVDLGLPDMAGQQLIEYLRRCTTTAVIVLTASNTLDTRVRSYQAGADLFLNKPVDSIELEAAINSLASRRKLAPVADTPSVAPVQAVTWQLEPAVWSLRCPGGRTVKFSPKEFLFVARLVTASGETVRREMLCSELYGRYDTSAEAALATLVKRVRSRIEQVTGTDTCIHTDHGVGYRFVAPVANN